MTYSIVTAVKRHDGKVDGYWLQDSIGTLAKARRIARRTSLLNSGADIAITEPVSSVVPLLEYWVGLKEIPRSGE